MASIRKRKWESGGATQAAWVVDYNDQAGKRRLKTFAKKKEADAWWATESGEVKRGTHTADSDSIKLSEAGELWIRHVRAEGRERSTVQQYEEHVKLHIVKLLGDVKLSKLTTPMVEEFKINLLETRSRPMAKKILTSLKMLLSAAQSAGKVAQNVASPVKIKGRRDRPKIEIPSKEDVNALITKAPDDFR